MTSTEFLEEMQRKISVGFKSQNPEMFDTVFEIDGKKLYANKFRLSLASTTFESMLSDRWTSKNDIIPIKDYKFEDFRDFLTFLYTGEYEFNDTNVLVMLDMAEFYQIEHLKKLCEKYLSKMKYTMDNIFHFIDVSDKYSLVYEWAENQATKKQESSCKENFNMNDEIKDQMQDFLPNIKFKKMRSSFLQEFVVTKNSMFTKDELNDILQYLHSHVTVKVTNLFGESIFGNLMPEYSDAIKAIKSLKNRPSENTRSTVLYWSNINCKIPSFPSQFKKTDDVKYYLDVFSNGDIGVCQNPGTAYILAEMTSEKQFEFTQKCKIEIV
uniref:BTB domain-containing protein n=1 Tax=Panagrolaimus davidi TaxID=227884 RepID=A0A914P8I2_9BILA